MDPTAELFDQPPLLRKLLVGIAAQPIVGKDVHADEIALLAGRGLSKREMAGLLNLSVRTVGNHINHVYGKLGITCRDELRVLVQADDVS